MTAPARITQADVERLVKGARNGGARQVKILLDASDRVAILIGFDEAAESEPDDRKGEWDDVLEEARQAQSAR